MRKKTFEYYNKRLQNVRGLVTPQSSTKDDHAYHLYIMKVGKDSSVSRDELVSRLSKYGIKTTVHYKPLHRFTAFKKFKGKDLKNSDELYDEIISLPFYPNMPKRQQDYVIDCIIKIMNG